jgi:NADH dehydrogenase
MPTLTKSTIEQPKKQRVLILGGGFGGIKVALELSQNTLFKVTLLSDSTHFRYYPALYRTATGGNQSASNIALKEIFEGKDIEIVNDSAKNLDRKSKIVKTDSGKNYSYDILVVALGVVTNFFGIKGLAENAYGIKSLAEARRLQDHMHRQLLDDKKPDLHYVVIGGGPTGVELAGALPGYIRHVMQSHGLENRSLHIELVEAMPRLVPRMSFRYSKALQKRLRQLGIHLHLKQTVQAETHDALMVNGQPIASHTVVWTAGVTNHPS